MASSHYDVVVVGARPAGAATAMLLARRGQRVLLLDRSRRGSDTLSTHALMRACVVQLERWGLLDRIIAAATPAIDRVTFGYGEHRVPVDLAQPLYAPRRTVLDAMLADAAEEAGATVEFGVHVRGLVLDGTGRVRGVSASRAAGPTFEVTADTTVGADGVRSLVAREAGAPVTTSGRAKSSFIYTYVERLTTDGIEWLYGSGVSAGLIPTNAGRHCVFAGAPSRRFTTELRFDLEAAFAQVLAEASPDAAARVRAAHRVGPLRGFAGIPGWLRRPYGPGWALVGDAGYFKDPQTAHGITDALRDAELLARALEPADDTERRRALQDYERVRDTLSHPLFVASEIVARFDWSFAELEHQHRLMSSAMQAEVAHLRALDLPDAVAMPTT